MAAEKLKVELQDENGNIYYLHTDASVVFCDDGTSVAAKLSNKLDTAKIVNNGLTTVPGFALDARYGRTLQDQITQLDSDLVNKSVVMSYAIPDRNGVSTNPEYISIGFHNVAKYSNGQCIYSAQVFIHPTSLTSCTIGNIPIEYIHIEQDIYSYCYDMTGNRFLLIRITPQGTVLLQTLNGTPVPQSEVRIRGSIVF